MSSEPKVSILISTYNRLSLWRRTLWALAKYPPGVPYEVIVVDDGSTEDVLGELRLYSSQFWWTFVRLDMAEFTSKTGIAKFFNNPSLSFNVAARLARSNVFVQQGNEILTRPGTYNQLLQAIPAEEDYLVFSTTYDMPSHILQRLDYYGSNLDEGLVQACRRWPLATPYFHADVTNYISVCSRALFEKLGGYNERYVGGIGKEDSDFVRRCRAIPDWTDDKCMRRTEFVSLHQSHGGRTRFYAPDPTVVTEDKWSEGECRSKAVWDTWDGNFRNGQSWEFGRIGVGDVFSNR